MSVDLGRSVVTILENVTVTNLMNENEELRHRENERLRVKITGPNGTPVYYQVSLKRGTPVKNEDLGDLWRVQFDENDPDYATLPLNNSVRAMEIWLGDILLHRLHLGTSFVSFPGYSRANGFDPNLINVPQMGTVAISTDLGQPNNISPVLLIFAKIGPILYNDFVREIPETNDAPGSMSMEQLVTLYRNDAAKQIGITGLVFRNTYIRGAISSLERIGISTTENDNDNGNGNDNNNGNNNGNDDDDDEEN
eukprot:CAMPEP_0170834786 /NCGR_PEP_ID=MMETSP0734-20130129/1171_1 /TAXON_ID=186038 /ORGANISM="Fragilariopsis kerguelensis, Strain L26-C5" /LENGTH=251 /DNA_ID=CAMNT_0011201433 /DNA_START=90 /DNA_END=845 /DNA_ORIENTATION=+